MIFKKPIPQTLFCLCLLFALNSLAMANEEFWQINFIQGEMADNLSSTQAAVQYGGDILKVPYKEKPANGNTFLLVEIERKKIKAGASKFEWKDFYVEDEQGNKYFRHPNDTFLVNHNFPRIKATTLTIGQYLGFVCFEVPNNLDKNKLSLVYSNQGSQIKIPMLIK